MYINPKCCMKTLKLHIGLILILALFSVEIYAQDEGCISGDCYTGVGTWKWPSGSTYIGEFKNRDREGYGYFKFPNGDEYIGNWKKNQRDGYGVYYYKSHGDYKRYAGEWKKDERTGMGIMYYNQASAKPQFGIWKDNKFEAKYKALHCVKGNCFQGLGIHVWDDGSRYEGNYKDGRRNGEGVFYYPKGAKYTGNQVNAQRNGFGTYYYTSGNKYVGEWNNDLKHGRGKLYSKGQVYKEGVWKNGKFVGSEIVEPISQRKDHTQKDTKAPIIKITKPEVTERGPKVVVREKSIIIGGIVEDESGIRRVRINGVTARLGISGTTKKPFAGKISLAKGQNDFWVEATDRYGNTIKKDFQIIYEPLMDEPILASNIISENRTALVIGNADYDQVPLKNPVNDARAIADRLKSFDFEVDLHLNVNQKDMKKAILAYGEKLKDRKGVGMVYYAGHGVQLNGQNYLIPLEAEISKPSDIDLEGVRLQRVLNEIEHATNRLNIVVLDACRDNPYAGVRGSGDGLTAPASAPSGTFIAFSTSPGRAASDGNGKHGLYTEALLKALDNAKGMKLEDIFKKVRSEVRKRSKRLQIPWETSSIEGDFYFFKGKK